MSSDDEVEEIVNDDVLDLKTKKEKTIFRNQRKMQKLNSFIDKLK